MTYSWCVWYSDICIGYWSLNSPCVCHCWNEWCGNGGQISEKVTIDEDGGLWWHFLQTSPQHHCHCIQGLGLLLENRHRHSDNENTEGHWVLSRLFRQKPAHMHYVWGSEGTFSQERFSGKTQVGVFLWISGSILLLTVLIMWMNFSNNSQDFHWL